MQIERWQLGWVSLVGTLLLSACQQGVELAREQPEPTSPDARARDAGPGINLGGNAAPDPTSGTAGGNAPPVGAVQGPLNLRVENIDRMTIQIVTLACAGDCADIQAVASGGNPPYEYAWEDGSRDPQRRVCLEASAQLSVQATDTAVEAGEFSYAPQTATTGVSAEVLTACTGDDGPFCLENPSLEGTPVLGLGTPDSVPPGWIVCENTPDTGPSISQTPASDGKSYLAISVFADAAETASGKFCAPLVAGQAQSFLVDLAPSSAFSAGIPQLQLWGGASPCSRDELLWTSPPLTELDVWRPFCGTLRPSQNFPFVVAVPIASPTPIGYVLVDHFRPTARCD